MRILLIGQCSLHWGRMEFGNIGNYYIIEPFVRELHAVFPGVEIFTTFQMSKDFCIREKVSVLPMKYYYNWEDEDLDIALLELSAARIYRQTGFLPKSTPYIEEVLKADLVIDFSGDIWGDNANFLGKNRFLVGLCKDRVAQLLDKPTVMLAGSPGPFHEQQTLAFAKEVFENFTLVTNREEISIELLEKDGFNTSNVKSLTCPAFLFEPTKGEVVENLIHKEKIIDEKKPTVGFILCGWNFTTGPFDKWPRDDDEYIQFAEVIEHVSEKLGARICLMSHSNGFHIPPEEFKLIHGRDYPIIKQLQKVVDKRGIAKNVFALDGIYSTWETKAILSKFDMLISGRVHGAVAGMSQSVPTVIIDYGHEPKAHKLKGFAQVAGMSKLVADPAKSGDLIGKVLKCWNERDEIRNKLNHHIPQVKKLAKENFSLLTQLVEPLDSMSNAVKDI